MTPVLQMSRRAGDRLRISGPVDDESADAATLSVWDNFQRLEREAAGKTGRSRGQQNLALASEDDFYPGGMSVWDNFQRLEREASASRQVARDR